MRRYWSITAAHSSESRSASTSVAPLTLANRTVSCLRSASSREYATGGGGTRAGAGGGGGGAAGGAAGGADVNGEPQLPQKRSVASTGLATRGALQGQALPAVGAELASDGVLMAARGADPSHSSLLVRPPVDLDEPHDRRRPPAMSRGPDPMVRAKAPKVTRARQRETEPTRGSRLRLWQSSRVGRQMGTGPCASGEIGLRSRSRAGPGGPPGGSWCGWWWWPSA